MARVVHICGKNIALIITDAHEGTDNDEFMCMPSDFVSPADMVSRVNVENSILNTNCLFFSRVSRYTLFLSINMHFIKKKKKKMGNWSEYKKLRAANFWSPLVSDGRTGSMEGRTEGEFMFYLSWKWAINSF